jgi:hypothetical protein
LREQESGGRRNPPDSAGIPAKNPVKEKKNRNSCDLSKTMFLRKIPPEKQHRKIEILRNPVFFLFLSPQKRIPENRNRQPRK